MPYVKVKLGKKISRVYALEPGDKVLRGGGGVQVASTGAIVAGPCADPQRVKQWKKDRLLVSDKKRKTKAKRKG